MSGTEEGEGQKRVGRIDEERRNAYSISNQELHHITTIKDL